ncbi:hypothetical protein [Leptospira yasudae]|uniref:Uncharacterized protein n=1 Tax=Leptospira yasudae TaxID=2202201 RepID=A0ABX9M272_9LEPT|nr:hypothetical protein [Leptospira yasudae]RHX78783.1 hypothetical protein DLM77_17135 [Leptospira yasudae]
MAKVNLEELKKIPYIDSNSLSNRIVPSLSFYEEEQWHIYFPSDNDLIKMKGAIIAEGMYFARKPESNSDLYLKFLDFLGQRVLTENLIYPIRGIEDDIMNIGASLRKFQILYEYSKVNAKDRSIDVSRMVVTELEYIILVCKSVFDLLQEIISKIWISVTMTDSKVKKIKLPKNFSKMVLDGDILLSAYAIEKKYNIPKLLADYYERQGHFFSMLRKSRVNITHFGSTVNPILITDRGFALVDTLKPFKDFNVWTESHKLPNGLASLRVSVAYIILKVLSACEDFTDTIQQVISFPSEISPGFHLFMKTYHGAEYLKLEKIVSECLWYDE